MVSIALTRAERTASKGRAFDSQSDSQTSGRERILRASTDTKAADS
jgi:hypothetical protein